jgi:hypothetical protein
LSRIAATRATVPKEETVPQTFVDVLVSVIPTEPLAAYTALVGVAVGAIGTGNAYLPFRWWVFAVFVAIVPIAVLVTTRQTATPPGDARRRFPFLEMVVSTLAAASWGLAMPGGPLNVVLSGTTLLLASSSVVIASAILISLLVPKIMNGTRQ